MNKTFDLLQIEAMWVLGMLPSAELPKLARSALTDGFESEVILQLAICSPNETEQIQKFFKQILKNGGGGAMSKIEALRHYAKQISSSILSDKISPLDGANLIWRATINAQDREFHELDSFIYAASEMEERPDDKQFFDNAIREEAQRWVKEI
ncbi:hypothetical protein [Collimonas fungivorans]|uniref:hypothetical protein n=1 Tax=Collimonas fungivorans TaxID=158899 RepID=UPI0007786D98|nr:hypothetical protein [Collimonas fungivorans]